ncbi:MAG: hypothetical protein ACFFDN_02735 [Candidatus Hodarchaeota archaeon]
MRTIDEILWSFMEVQNQYEMQCAESRPIYSKQLEVIRSLCDL